MRSSKIRSRRRAAHDRPRVAPFSCLGPASCAQAGSMGAIALAKRDFRETVGHQVAAGHRKAGAHLGRNHL